MSNQYHSEMLQRYSEHGPTLTEVLKEAARDGQISRARFLIVAGRYFHDDTSDVEAEIVNVLRGDSRSPWPHMQLDFLHLASEGRDPRNSALHLLEASKSCPLTTIRGFYRSAYNPNWARTFLRTLLETQTDSGRILLFLTRDQLQILKQAPQARSCTLVLLQD